MRAAHTMTRRHWFALLLMPLATVAVHQLRYLLVYGSHAGRALADQGDSYVESLTPVLGVLLAFALGVLVLQLARASSPSPGGSGRPRRLWILWAGASIALLAGYLVQESMEVVLGSAHTTLLTQAFGGGGWCVLPVATGVGLGWALVARGARAALQFVARRRSARYRTVEDPRLTPLPRPFAAVLVPPRCPLSRRLAGRAPPFRVALS